MAILFGLASKMVNLLSDGQFVELHNPKLNHSMSILSALLTMAQPFLWAATRALTALKISWSFPCSSLKIWHCASSRVSTECSAILAECGWQCCSQGMKELIGQTEAVPTCSIAICWCTVQKLPLFVNLHDKSIHYPTVPTMCHHVWIPIRACHYGLILFRQSIRLEVKFWPKMFRLHQAEA